MELDCTGLRDEGRNGPETDAHGLEPDAAAADEPGLVQGVGCRGAFETGLGSTTTEALTLHWSLHFIFVTEGFCHLGL